MLTTFVGNEPNTTSNFIWTAENFADLDQNDPMHLWITNSEDSECGTCACRSSNFTVLDSMSSNTSSTSAPTATSLEGSSTASAGTSSDASDNNLKLGLGLGLGLGLPLLIIITALATWLCVRRRRQQRQVSLTAGAYDGSLGPTFSATMPLDSATTYTQPSSLGYVVSDPSEKSPTPEMDSHPIVEMQTNNTRVEAPQGAYRAELAGDDGMARAYRPNVKKACDSGSSGQHCLGGSCAR